MKALGENIGHGQQSIAQLCQSAENNLAPAGHAETWSCKEAETQPKKGEPRSAVYILQKDWSDRKAGGTLRADDIGDGAIYRIVIDQGAIVEAE